MKYFLIRVVDFVAWIIATLFTTVLLWLFITDGFGLSFNKTLSIVVGVWLLWQYLKNTDELAAISKREIANRKRAETILEEVNKTLAANTPEAKLEEYRRTFGQSEKK